mgnify:CR=1 FL=1
MYVLRVHPLHVPLFHRYFLGTFYYLSEPVQQRIWPTNRTNGKSTSNSKEEEEEEEEEGAEEEEEEGGGSGAAGGGGGRVFTSP